MPIHNPTPLLIISLILALTAIVSPASTDYTALVYKGCSKQTLNDPSGSYRQSLATLTAALVQQSTKSRFSKSSSGQFQGRFQCRGDLSAGDCSACVARLPSAASSLCGPSVAAARVQLVGCYIAYEVSGFAQISGLDLLFKTCGSSSAAGAGFEERRGTALSVLENGITSGNGFYAGSYQGVYVVGQCEGELGGSDCGECVKTAVQRSEVECGGAISGQVYLHKCFISYSYYPNGVPRRSSSSASDGEGGGGGGGGSGDTLKN